MLACAVTPALDSVNANIVRSRKALAEWFGLSDNECASRRASPRQASKEQCPINEVCLAKTKPKLAAIVVHCLLLFRHKSKVTPSRIFTLDRTNSFANLLLSALPPADHWRSQVGESFCLRCANINGVGILSDMPASKAFALVGRRSFGVDTIVKRTEDSQPHHLAAYS